MNFLKKVSAFLIGMTLTTGLLAQSQFSLSGYVRDASNGEELISATVYTEDNSSVVSTNFYGFYSLPLEEGIHKVTFSYVGYESFTKEFNMNEDQAFDIELSTDAVNINEAVVEGEAANSNVKDVEMSVNEMDIKTITGIPALLGEADVIRAVQTMPGVATVGEGATGFNVRGGGIDENLILLDEAPVFNSSHLLGFFSVFNPDVIKNVKLVKGGIPAEYGGRLSSILDVRNKDGNKKEFHGQGGIGSVFTRLTLEGPIKKDKASFIVAGRRSYIDILAKPFLNDDFKDAKFNFYDLSGKVNWRLNDNNNFFISSYTGGDRIGFEVLDFSWGNTTTTARWNHIFNNKVFMNLTAIYSDYKYSFDIEEEDDGGFNWRSRIQNSSLKNDYTYFANKNNTIKFGISGIMYEFIPAEAEVKNENETIDISLPRKYSMEAGAYIQNEQKIGSKLTLQYGVRYSLYQYFGGRPVYNIEDPEVLGTQATLVSEDNSYGRWDAVKTYGNIEPRFGANFSLSKTSSIKASYNRMTQYIHLLSNSVAATPIDIWTPVSNNLKPTIADQVALGYFRNFKENMFEFSAEVYYKETQNVIDYINGADLFFNDIIEADLLAGEGRSYGLELYLKKSKGDYTGWISYTLSKSERRIDGISNSDWFDNRYDRRHNGNINVSRTFSDRWSASVSFSYASGTPSTFPTNRVDVQGWVLPHNVNNERNSFRIPSYHRADLGVTRKSKIKEGKKWQGEWVFSVYNIYGRRNPYLFFFQQNEDKTGTEAVRYSVVGSMIPSVTYNFNF